MRLQAFEGLVLLLLPVLVPDYSQAQGSADTLRTFAAVYMVRGSVAGRSTGEFGLFLRKGNDTTWVRVSRSNVYTFGLGRYERGNSLRYYVAAGNGIHRSTDRGATWKIVTSWETKEVLAVVADPVDSTVLYAATPEGVFKTTNDGLTWVAKTRGFKRWFVPKLIMDAEERNVLYAAAEDDLYRTTDGGEHWAPAGPGVPHVQALYQSPSKRDLFFCAAEDSGVFVSRDTGRTWRRGAGLESSTIYAFAGSPGGTEYFAGGWETGIWHSTDAGAHWSCLWTDPAVQAVFAISVDPRNPDHLLAGTDGQGVYESFDRGKSWRWGGMMGTKVKDVTFFP